MRRILTAIVVTGGLTLSACSSENSGEFTNDDGETGTYSIDEDSGETQMSITTDDGTATFRSGSEVPVDLPLGFTAYPGSKITNNAVVDHNGGEGSMVFFTTADSPSDVLDFYRKQAEAADIEISVEMSMNEGGMLAGEGASGGSFSINATPGEDGTSAQLLVGNKLGE